MIYRKNKLKMLLKKCDFAFVCLSGGLDSCLLLHEVHSILGERVHAITFVSPLQRQRNVKNARDWAAKIGVKHIMVDYYPLSLEDIIYNRPERCYMCKTQMFSIAYGLVTKQGQGGILLEGTHQGDDPLLRPGMKANKEFGVCSPWRKLGLGKADIKKLAREKGLSFWSRPTDSCLATRFPVNYKLKIDELKKLEEAEDALAALGFIDFRFRPADFTPRLLLSEKDLRMAKKMGVGKVLSAIRERSGWAMENVCMVLK